jgi:hypothetical protein
MSVLNSLTVKARRAAVDAFTWIPDNGYAGLEALGMYLTVN